MSNIHSDFDEIRFRIAVDAAPNAMIMTDEKGYIILANQQAELLFGYSKAELLGQLIEILVPSRYRKHHPKDRSDFWSNPEPRKMGVGRDLYGVKKNSQEFPIEIGLTPIQLSNSRYVISAIVDITERRRVEDSLKAKSEELARSNSELEQFAYVASHDLQAPLRHITSYVQLLSMEMEGKLDDKTKQWMEFILSGTKRMQQLINGLLSFSRVRRGQVAFDKVDLNITVQNSIQNLLTVINEEKAEVSVSKLPTVYGDSLLIQQVFQNLIENAIKFKNKELTPKVSIFSEERKEETVITIEDNGIGISQEFQEQVFVIFQRLHTLEEYPGTGIGLAICKKIMDFHGGRIWFESNQFNGASFRISFLKNKESLINHDNSHG